MAAASVGRVDAPYRDAVESLDADLLASQFASAGSFQLADRAPLIGRTPIRRAFLHLFTEVDTIEHRVVAVWNRGGVLVSDLDVTFVLPHGSIELPVTVVLYTRNGEILSCRVLFYSEPALQRLTQFF